MNIAKRLNDLAAQRGLTVRDCGNGHYQIRGDSIVNYWPHSEKQTAVGSTGGAVYNVTPELAVEMAIDRSKPPAHSKSGDKQWIDKFGRDLIVSAVQGAAIDAKPFDDAPLIADTAIAIRNAVFERLGLEHSE